MTDRDRKSRFRVVLPVVKAGLLALVPALIFFTPDTHPYAIPAVLMTAMIVQLASPWNEVAARYSEYVRANDNEARRRKPQVANERPPGSNPFELGTRPASGQDLETLGEGLGPR